MTRDGCTASGHFSAALAATDEYPGRTISGQSIQAECMLILCEVCEGCTAEALFEPVTVPHAMWRDIV